MSDQLEGFRGRSIDDVQRRLFLRDLPKCGGRFRYPRAGLSAPAGTVFIRDEKVPRPRGGCAGAMHFDPGSIRTFDPVDVEAMRKSWPSFRAFGHVKQYLNPARYPMFKRRLRNVASP
jgi:hypothetical protein